jgi:hypothetical protein
VCSGCSTAAGKPAQAFGVLYFYSRCQPGSLLNLSDSSSISSSSYGYAGAADGHAVARGWLWIAVKCWRFLCRCFGCLRAVVLVAAQLQMLASNVIRYVYYGNGVA